jgi:hypothetical protein
MLAKCLSANVCRTRVKHQLAQDPLAKCLSAKWFSGARRGADGHLAEDSVD